jgi:hypothetical protein
MEPTSFTFMFTQPIFSLQPQGQVPIQLAPSLAVTMSPILAKELLKALQRAISQYEQHIGAPIPDMPTTPIPLPP